MKTFHGKHENQRIKNDKTNKCKQNLKRGCINNEAISNVIGGTFDDVKTPTCDFFSQRCKDIQNIYGPVSIYYFKCFFKWN